MATIITRASKGAALSHAEMDANWTNLNDNTEQFANSGATALPFFQASAPLGWTQNTSINDAMLRIVSTAGGGSGGSDSASFNNKVPSHTHTASSAGAHTHVYREHTATGGGAGPTLNQSPANSNTSSTGAHTHDVTANPGAQNWEPKFLDIIVASKD